MHIIYYKLILKKIFNFFLKIKIYYLYAPKKLHHT
jgi:hypothetical protein